MIATSATSQNWKKKTLRAWNLQHHEGKMIRSIDQRELLLHYNK
jgi:hypothetical protein